MKLFEQDLINKANHFYGIRKVQKDPSLHYVGNEIWPRIYSDQILSTIQVMTDELNRVYRELDDLKIEIARLKRRI